MESSRGTRRFDQPDALSAIDRPSEAHGKPSKLRTARLNWFTRDNETAATLDFPFYASGQSFRSFPLSPRCPIEAVSFPGSRLLRGGHLPILIFSVVYQRIRSSEDGRYPSGESNEERRQLIASRFGSLTFRCYGYQSSKGG